VCDSNYDGNDRSQRETFQRAINTTARWSP